MLDADRGICTHPGAFQLIVTLIIGAFASGEFVLYDQGLEANRYDLETLVNGDGRWVLGALSKARPAEDDVTVFADLAIIRLDADLSVKYRRQANQWRLISLYRAGQTPSQ